MRVEHFFGKIETIDLKQVINELKKRTDDGFNEFWISMENDYPCICASYNNQYVHVHYFSEEGDCGKQLLSSNPKEGTTKFYTNAPNETFFIDNRYVIDSENAEKVIIDFCNGDNISDKYEFEGL